MILSAQLISILWNCMLRKSFIISLNLDQITYSMIGILIYFYFSFILETLIAGLIMGTYHLNNKRLTWLHTWNARLSGCLLNCTGKPLATWFSLLNTFKDKILRSTERPQNPQELEPSKLSAICYILLPLK